MRFLIDSANLDEVREAMTLPYVEGVTTNPREISYHGLDDLAEYLKELRRIARGTIYVQVTAPDADTMVAEGRAIAAAIKDVRVKIPVTAAGLVATRKLADGGVRVSGTAVNSVTMALLAGKAGAESVIPYYGAMEDFEYCADDFLCDIMDAFDMYECKTELVYFARNLRQVREGIRAGAQGCLMTLGGLKSLTDDPLAKVAVDFMHERWNTRYGNTTWVTALGQPAKKKR